MHIAIYQVTEEAKESLSQRNTFFSLLFLIARCLEQNVEMIALHPAELRVTPYTLPKHGLSMALVTYLRQHTFVLLFF